MVGVDIVDVSRIEKLETQKLATRILSKQEQEYLNKKSNLTNGKPSEYIYSLAGFWAAKEAFLKAIGVGLDTDNLNQIEILHKASGEPYVKINDKLFKKYSILNGKSIQISISHDANMAISVCFIV